MKKQTGFTLIEVMVAVGIFAFAGAAIMKATYEHLRSLSSLEEITIATWVANNQMTEALLENRVKTIKSNSKGVTEMSGKQWFWSQEVKNTQDPSLSQITIIVALDEKMSNEVTAVTSFIAKVEK